MTAYDWLMACGVVVLVAFVVKAFRRSNKIDPIEQPDNWMQNDSRPNDGHSPGD